VEYKSLPSDIQQKLVEIYTNETLPGLRDVYEKHVIRDEFSIIDHGNLEIHIDTTNGYEVKKYFKSNEDRRLISYEDSKNLLNNRRKLLGEIKWMYQDVVLMIAKLKAELEKN
jgi:hypothetical protein